MSARKRQRDVNTVTKKDTMLPPPARTPVQLEAPHTETSTSSNTAENQSSSANSVGTRAISATAPMSAVAARKAAIARQKAQEHHRQHSDASATASEVSASETESESESQSESVSDRANESSSRFDRKGPGRKAYGNRMKQRQRPTAPSRYYQAESSTEGQIKAEASQSPAVTPRFPSQHEEEETNMLNDTNGKTKMGRGKRQRREKSAFMDPACISGFLPVVGSNLFRLGSATGVANAHIFCLRANENLIIHGAFGLRVLAGQVNVMGATLTASAASHGTVIDAADYLTATQHDLFAPSSHPLPVIEAGSSSKLSSTTMRMDDGAKVDVSEYTVILMVHDHDTGIEIIEKVLQNAGMGCANNMWSVPDDLRASVGSENIPIHRGNTWTLINAATPTLTSLRLIEDWRQALSTLNPGRQHDNRASSDRRPDIEREGEEEEDDDDEEELRSQLEDETPGRIAVLVEGPKRSGKSTFTRMAVNALLDRFEAVAYLDTDCGQPELTTPGFVSLSVLRKPVLGPSFTHLTIPMSSYFIGSTSPAADPSAYSEAIAALLSTYYNEIEFPATYETPRNRRRIPAVNTNSTERRRISTRVPLVVNTQGWVKGLGADLLTQLKADVRPTRVFSFDTMEEEVPEWRSTQPIPTTRLSVSPSTPLESKWSAADLRTLAFIAYFHGVYPSAESSRQHSNVFPSAWNFEQSLISRTPIALDWRPEAGQLDSVHVLHDTVPHQQILYALNGSIVALATPSSTTTDSDTPPSATARFPYVGSDRSPLARAAGLAILRSIDPATSTLHLLTPLAARHLGGEPLVLVKGSIDLPIPLMLDHTASEGNQMRGLCGSDWKDVPYLSLDAAEVGGRRRVRRNLMRRSQA